MTRHMTRWMLAVMCALVAGCDESTEALVFAGLQEGAQSIVGALIDALFAMLGSGTTV